MSKLTIVVNPTESGLEEKKAKEIESLFLPMVKMVNDMEKAFNEVVSKEKTQETAATARLLRLRIAAERVKADKARKSAKDEYLRAGNAIQGAFNAFLYASKSKEEKLLGIEKFAEVQEKERIEKLKNKRSSILFEIGVTEDDIQFIQLGEMKTEVWENYLIGQKASFKAKKEAEAQAELDRIAAEKKAEEERLEAIEEQKRITSENEKLKKEAELQEAKAKKEKERVEAERAKAEAERQKELDKIKAEQDKKDQEAAKREAEAKAKADEIQKQLDEEREKRERLLAEEKEAEQNKLKQGDSENIKDLISDLQELKTKYTFKSKKFKTIYSQVGMLIDKVIGHINK